jgi:site-specific recombinase XerD
VSTLFFDLQGGVSPLVCGRLDDKVIQRLLSRVSGILGVHVHPHLLRNFLAVHLLWNNVDVRVIQEILGHARLDTTKVYLRLVPGDLNGIALSTHFFTIFRA